MNYEYKKIPVFVEENLFSFQLEEKILEITTSKDQEIKIRDEKLTRLKNQMADALKGNSWLKTFFLHDLFSILLIDTQIFILYC